MIPVDELLFIDLVILLVLYVLMVNKRSRLASSDRVKSDAPANVIRESLDFDIEHLVYDIFKLAQVRFTKQQSNSYIDFDANIPRWVKGDPTRLRQVLSNLIEHSISFTDHGDIGLTVRFIKVDADQTAWISFLVRNSGGGIALDTQRILFVCKKIVVDIGGDIGVRSALGRGSEFYFTIPFKKGQSLVEQQIEPLGRENLVGKKVILIDAHVPSLQIMTKYCKEMGLNVLASVNNGPTALNVVNRLFQKGVLPDIVLTDVVIPGINGYDFAHKIRLVNSFKSLRIVAITSDAYVGIAQIAQEKGFDGYLPKPISRMDLFNMIATVLGDKRPANAPIVTRHVVKELRLKGLKILVADDSIATLEQFKKHLDVFGCVMDVAHNGQEAVEKIQKDSYDLCLMDLQMPFLNGEEAARILRTLGQTDLPIIALSEEIIDIHQVRYQTAGLSDYLIKPVQLRVLEEKINQWVKDF